MKAIYIPNGPKNLASLFPDIDFRDIEDYHVVLTDEAFTEHVSGTWNTIQVCSEDHIRIHFLNSLGAIDAMNFEIVNIESENKSDSYESAPNIDLQKKVHGINRFNVKTNSTYTVRNCDYTEEDREWIEELFASPLAWIEWKGIQNQPDSYLPIVIIDQKMPLRKEDDRFYYEVNLQFKLSHERYNLRN